MRELWWVRWRLRRLPRWLRRHSRPRHVRTAGRRNGRRARPHSGHDGRRKPEARLWQKARWCSAEKRHG